MRTRSCAAALLAAGLAAGCSGGSGGSGGPSGPRQDAPTSTSEPEVTTSSPTSVDEPTERPAFDCDAVADAQQTLGSSATAELERLGIERGAPEAFTVVLLATSQGGAEYWDAVAQAVAPDAPDEVRTDVRLVADYWAALDGPLSAIEVADSSPAAVAAAGAELAAVNQSRPDEALAPAQQRIQDQVGGTCGLEPGTGAGSS